MTDSEQKINELANVLFSKGFSASLWDAKNKAKDILRVTTRKVNYRNEQPKNEASINQIIKSAGVTEQAIKKAEEEKLEKVKISVQNMFDEKEAVNEPFVDKIVEQASQKTNITIEVESKQPVIEEEMIIQKVEDAKIEAADISKEQPRLDTIKAEPVVYFSESVEGADASTPVSQLVGDSVVAATGIAVEKEMVKEELKTEVKASIEPFDINKMIEEAGAEDDDLGLEVKEEVSKNTEIEQDLPVIEEKDIAVDKIEIISQPIESPIIEIVNQMEATPEINEIQLAAEEKDLDSAAKDENEGYVVLEDKAEEKEDEALPKLDDEFKEEESPQTTIIEKDNVFTDVDKNKVEEEKNN